MAGNSTTAANRNRTKNYVGGAIILLIIIAVFVLMTKGSRAAGHAQSRIQPGMDLQTTIASSPGFWACGGTAAGGEDYFRVITSEDAKSFSFKYLDHERKVANSEQELAAFIAEAMAGRPFHMWFSYMGVRRSGFGVDFDGARKVIAKTDVATSD
jgi:hypothetical protein